MVSAPTRVRAPIAEKYINMRTQSFTRTHARALQAWLNEGRGTEEDYYAWFRKEVDRSAKKWADDCAAIDRDPGMNFREKREEKNKLHRFAPAWDLLQEEAFIRQWGDPRKADRGRLESLLIGLESHLWENAVREGQQVVLDKKPWERKFHEAVTNPQDGSVPLFMDAAEIRVAEPYETPRGQDYKVVEPEPQRLTMTMPEIPEVEVEAPMESHGIFLTEQQKSAFKKQVEMQAKRTCPLCLVTFPKGLKPQHVGSAGCKAAQEALK